MTLEERISAANTERPLIEVVEGDVMVPVKPARPERGRPVHCKHLGWGTLHSFTGQQERYAYISKDKMYGCDLTHAPDGLRAGYVIKFGSPYTHANILT